MKCDYNKCGCHSIIGTPIGGTIPPELQPFIKHWPTNTWMQNRLAKLLRDKASEIEVKNAAMPKVQS